MKSILLQTALVLGLFGGLQIAIQTSAIAETTKPQGEVIPFDAEKWNFIGGTKIVDHQGKKALQLGVKAEGAPFGFGLAMLKETPFTNGIVEYDVLFDETRTFAGLLFRLQRPGFTENFYMRAHQSGNPDANQYMPVYNGIPSWQLYYGAPYSANTKYSFNKWMHVKVVVQGNLADFYIEDMRTPAFTSELKHGDKTGALGLWGLNLGGTAWFANFAVKPMDSVEIKGTPVPETAAVAGTIMSWQVSGTFDGKSIDGNANLSKDVVADLSFGELAADKTGLTNLAKVQGVEQGKDTVFAKVMINSDAEQTKKFEFGFSDRVRIYLNGQPLFDGSDARASRDYRFLGSVGFYDSIYLPLKQGDNELLIAVTEDVIDLTGWAVQGRFEDMSGLKIQ